MMPANLLNIMMSTRDDNVRDRAMRRICVYPMDGWWTLALMVF